jgi:hypothetical protein
MQNIVTTGTIGSAHLCREHILGKNYTPGRNRAKLIEGIASLVAIQAKQYTREESILQARNSMTPTLSITENNSMYCSAAKFFLKELPSTKRFFLSL